MSTTELLRQTVADFCAVDPNQVDAGFPLWRSAVGGSLKQARLDVALRRRVGWQSDAVYTARTYGDLLNAFLGQPAADAPAVAPMAEPPDVAPREGPAAVRCGVDLERVAGLPVVADCWEDPFYRGHF